MFVLFVDDWYVGPCAAYLLDTIVIEAAAITLYAVDQREELHLPGNILIKELETVQAINPR
jgi:hypothetical protein